MSDAFRKIGGSEMLGAGGQKRVPENFIKDFRIGIPSFPEQKQIAYFLDWKTGQIDALIAKKQELIEKLREKRIAIITQAVTKGLNPDAPMRDSGIPWLGQVPEHWEIPALKFRYQVELGKMLDEKRITGEHLIPYLRNIDVQWDKINSENLPVMDITQEEYPRYTVREGDVLVCEGGEVGRSAVVGENYEIIGFQKAIHRLRAYSSAELPRFVYYTLLWAVNIGVFSVEGSSTIAHLTAEQLRCYRFPQPPRSEQEEIIAYLEDIVGRMNCLAAKVETVIDRLTEYRTALITAATTGKIDVRGIKVGNTYND
jgi:type I restriction enzyme S subunit